MPLLTSGPTPGKIDNTSASADFAPTVTYQEEDPVSTTDCNRIFFPLLLVVTFFLPQYLNLNIFFERGTFILHHTSLSSLMSLKIL